MLQFVGFALVWSAILLLLQAATDVLAVNWLLGSFAFAGITALGLFAALAFTVLALAALVAVLARTLALVAAVALHSCLFVGRSVGRGWKFFFFPFTLNTFYFVFCSKQNAVVFIAERCAYRICFIAVFRFFFWIVNHLKAFREHNEKQKQERIANGEWRLNVLFDLAGHLEDMMPYTLKLCALEIR